MLNIHEPKFVVFYNGEQEYPATKISKLSDMYINKSETPALELIVTIININPGYNDDILDASESLKGYMTFVNKVRIKRKNNVSIEISVEEAIKECIEENIMAEFFLDNKEKIKNASIWEFNQELNDQAKYEEGLAQGISILINYSKELGISYDSTKSTLISKYQITLDEAEKYMLENW